MVSNYYLIVKLTFPLALSKVCFLSWCHPLSSLGSTKPFVCSSSSFGIVISPKHPMRIYYMLPFSFYHISQGTFGEFVAIFYSRRGCKYLELTQTHIKVCAKFDAGASWSVIHHNVDHHNGLLSLAQLPHFSEGYQLSQQQCASVTTATLSMKVLLEK